MTARPQTRTRTKGAAPVCVGRGLSLAAAGLAPAAARADEPAPATTTAPVTIPAPVPPSASPSPTAAPVPSSALPPLPSATPADEPTPASAPAPGPFAGYDRVPSAGRRPLANRLAGVFRRDPSVEPAAAPAPGATSEVLPWWTVPRRARAVARQYAAAQKATVTRYVRVAEPNGTAHFEIFASRRVGNGAREEFVLVSVPDPEAQPKP